MPVTYQTATLDNGLTITAETDPQAHTSAIGFFVKTGARDEQAPVMGVSHFLEHMMFKGTDRRSAADVNREFDELGAEYNAYTSHEVTCYHATVLPEMLPGATDLLADMLRPALRDDDFDTEKNVILEEIAMYNDQPFWTLYEEVMAQHYHNHPMGFRVLGTNDTITAMTAGQMRGYFNERYAPDNMCVAVAGNVEFDKVCAHINELCSSWQASGTTRDAGALKTGADEVNLTDERVVRAYLLMMAAAPAAQSDERYAAALLARILGKPGNSRLHWALIETGIAEEALADYDPHDNCGDYYLYASCTPDKLDEVRAIVNKELAELAGHVSENDLARLRASFATQTTVGGERPAGRMQRLGRLWTDRGSYTPLEDELAAINAVTVADVQAIAERLATGPKTFGTLVPA